VSTTPPRKLPGSLETNRALDQWLSINADGTVTVRPGKVEIGQGILTALVQIVAEDVMSTAASMLSVFIREPEFQGQTKDKLATLEASRIVENTVRDAFDHWLAASPSPVSDWRSRVAGESSAALAALRSVASYA